ncbi:unnamed protein product [Diamesa hyperborea]
MSILQADIDATCSSLGYNDGNKYYIEADAVPALKHLIWILKRDDDSHEYRRYIGHKKVIQTDLLPMIINHCDDPVLADILLRLLVNLTNPTLLFFREDLPKNSGGRRTYMDLVEISHTYKEAFAYSPATWSTLAIRLQKILEIEIGERLEEQSLVIERILVLTRNVLQVPANPQHEKRVDNDVSVHDQVLWALHESGMLELILFILCSQYEIQYHLHALEIVFLIFREQRVETLADASLQRSAAEKLKDEQELIAARTREKLKSQVRLPPARHSRFGGTYVYKNLKSISDNDMICHQSLERVVQKEFNTNKNKIKTSFRLAKDDDKFERQSAFTIRLFLREFCIEILTSAFNNLVHQVRRALERSRGQDAGNDESYLLWAIRFFLEFNRLNGFKLALVSETLCVGTIHWITGRMQHDVEMIGTDKHRKLNWNRRLQLGVKAYREFLFNIQLLELTEDEDCQGLMNKLRNNMFYVVEYREIILQLLLQYTDSNFTKSYLRDIIDTVNIYLKMLEKFCKGNIVVQKKVKKTKKKSKKPKKLSKEDNARKLEQEWDGGAASSLSVVLSNPINIPEEEHPIPFDAALEKSIDDQKGDCMIKIHKCLRGNEFEHAVLLLRAARTVWTDENCFGTTDILPEDELLVIKEIFFIQLDLDDDEAPSDDDPGSDSEEDHEPAFTEVVLNFEDFEKRLMNPKVVRACTWVLQGWEKITYREIKSACTILHRIAFNQKMTVMLFQTLLFRVFQQVFKAPRDARYEELRRLGIFTIRSFVKMAPKNPKLFAELLFFHSNAEAYQMVHGYDSEYSGASNKKGNSNWSVEEEEELTRLFMENQENPATDMDVIDWIVDNLIDQSRTRRNVLIQMKKLGLIFKAPTKRSTKAACNKNVFIEEEDIMIREMYDAHRHENDCLKQILDVFDKKRNQQQIVQRMIYLGLIADKSEIIPKKKNVKREEAEGNSSGEESDGSDHNMSFDQKKKQIQVKKQVIAKKVRQTQLKITDITFLRLEVEESWKEAIEWVIESLKEAAEDFEEPSDDPDDAIPLVPFQESHKEALMNPQFQKLMESVGILAPSDMESYWRIPATFHPDELNKRAGLLSGEVTEDNPTNDNDDSDGADDVSDDLFDHWRKQRTNLVYNKSDSEDEGHNPLPPAAPKKIEVPTAKKQKKQPPKPSKKSSKKKTSDDDEDTNELEINTQQLKQKLLELNDLSDNSDNDNGHNLSTTKHMVSKRKFLESSDEEEESTNLDNGVEDEEINQTMDVKKRLSTKRDRSEIGSDLIDEDDDDDEENMKNISNKQKLKRIKILAESSDDE